MQVASWLLLAVALAPAAQAPKTADASARAVETSADEQVARAAGLATDGPALLDFFRGRSLLGADGDELRALVRQLGDAAAGIRARAAAALVARGPVAVPILRQAANDLADPAAAERARQCLKWAQGPDGAALAAAVARLVAERKPAGAAPVLLAYLPFADEPAVVDEVTAALAAGAYANGRPDPALLRALGDSVPLRRAAAGEALCRAGQAESLAAVRSLLQDPVAGVRLRVALALLRHEDAEAAPVLIGLLAGLPPAGRRQAEEALKELAGDWAPGLPLDKDDAISQRIRHDAWAAWWKNTEGPALLAEFRRRTPGEAERAKIRALIGRLGADEFAVRERAMADLIALDRMAVPFLRQAARGKDLERVRRAESCLARIARGEKKALPLAAARLAALRRPPGATEALLAYLPWASEPMAEEVRKALVALAVQDGKVQPALVKALADPEPLRRLAAGVALAQRGGSEHWPALRKLLRDPAAAVRVQVGAALITARDRAAVPLLIDALADLPAEQASEALDTLSQLAGDKGPDVLPAGGAAAQGKLRDAWAAWWKAHGAGVDLARLGAGEHYLGYTLLVEGGPANGRVREIGRSGQTRWQVEGLQYPVDAHVIGGNRVLIVEYNGRRVSERDFKGNILWKVQNLPNLPVNAQRLPGGNTFIATMSNVMEVDRKGHTVFTHTLPGQTVQAACKVRGTIYCLTQQGQCILLNAGGKQLKSFPSGQVAGWTSGIDVGPAGQVLVANSNQGRVTEFDRQGKQVWQAQAPGVTTATRLPSGHVLAASYGMRTVTELDRTGRTVWQFRSDRPLFRARRR